MKNAAQFKANLESITLQDVINVRRQKETHALDLMALEIPLKMANEYVEVMRDFLEQDLNYSSDRVENVECRRRDGFIPHSYNHGGLDACSYRDHYGCCENTGFKGTDAALARSYECDLQCFLYDNGLPEGHELTEEQLEQFDNYRMNCDDTVQFQARIMMTSETTANADFYVSASDSPYHRKSDDRLELEITFKTPAGMRRQLKRLLKNKFVSRLASNVRESF